ncbi:hypothetical protein ZWY2020_044779 [Hordeum vulgare]|nr:hypothetical protein ZWY2020_044779 [Hordeum vulgare]
MPPSRHLHRWRRPPFPPRSLLSPTSGSAASTIFSLRNRIIARAYPSRRHHRPERKDLAGVFAAEQADPIHAKSLSLPTW